MTFGSTQSVPPVNGSYTISWSKEKILVGNKIELGIEIPTIESRASNIPMTKGTTYVVMRFDR